jgi:hypothetical protein
MLSQIYEATALGGCVVTENGVIPVDISTSNHTVQRVSEKLMKVDDVDGTCKCICHCSAEPGLAPVDLLMAPFCDLLMVLGVDGGKLYSGSVLKRMNAALPMEG